MQRSLRHRTTVKALGSLDIRVFTFSGFEQHVGWRFTCTNICLCLNSAAGHGGGGISAKALRKTVDQFSLGSPALEILGLRHEADGGGIIQVREWISLISTCLKDIRTQINREDPFSYWVSHSLNCLLSRIMINNYCTRIVSHPIKISVSEIWCTRTKKFQWSTFFLFKIFFCY